MIQKELYNFVKEKGRICVIRKQLTKEVCNYSFNVTDFNYKLNKSQYEYVRRKLLKYKKDINQCIKKLVDDNYSRQGVIAFDINSNKPNCVMSLQYLIRNNKIYCIATSRSLDIENKLLQDIEISRKIGEKIKEATGYDFYMTTFNVGSLHFYLK